MRALLLSLLCVGPAWGRLCQDNTFWSNEQDRCLPCTVCAPGDQQLLSCQPFQDTICQPSPRRVPPPPPTEEEVHRARLEEERARATQARAVETLQVERTRLETLVYEWQTTVFVVSILVTFALVFSFLAVLLRRTRTAIRKGVEDYSHLVLNREEAHREPGDQSSLAFADFDKIKIGRRPFDSPYADLSSPRSSRGRADTACAASVNLLPKHNV